MDVLLISFLVACRCMIAFAASIPASFDVAISGGRDVNIALSRNFTVASDLTLETHSNGLPSDPYFYECPVSSSDPAVVIKFYAYGRRVPYEEVRQALAEAVQAAQRHPRQEILPSTIRQFESGHMHLVVHSTSYMTWGVLHVLALGIWNFAKTYESVDLDFDVGMEGVEKFYGTGALAYFGSAAAEK